ncbi:GGDEF domain-containing protein [Paucibacter sp. APW11]|uniref:GGDEF domain-containing protein n=1 Tax=Roseateles aquae TaxID=3077235 RepID=A0ABU3P8Z2_9BURK|nr:GGDEF domain-containing protein [Paucibacter sp. APW11]MDT8999032.1 GGDEF domain-containing protein [Paucibacter sp. APW11]
MNDTDIPAVASLDDPADAAWATLFELAPVSLWLEDFSGLARLFAAWRSMGVVDLHAHLGQDPAHVQACIRKLRVLRVNERSVQLLGAPDAATLLARLDEVFRGDLLEHLVPELVHLWEGRLSFSCSAVNYTLDGRRLDVMLQIRVLPGHEQNWGRVLLALEDISERERARLALQRAEQYAAALFEHSPVSLWVEDFSAVKRELDLLSASGVHDLGAHLAGHPEFIRHCLAQVRVLQVNRHTLRLFRAADQASLVSNLPRLLRDEVLVPFAEQLVELWNGQLVQQRETINYTMDGELMHMQMQFAVLPGHESDWSHVQISLTDISARKKAEAYLEYLGKHDPLTKLGNRSFFSEEVARLERRAQGPVAVLVIDVNGLKQVNDESGHAAGDALLRRAGEVLMAVIEPPMSASRIGGDEFVLLLPDADQARGERLVAELQELLEMNNQFHGGFALSFATGLAIWQAGERMELTVQRADEAMYALKRSFYANREHERRRGLRAGDAMPASSQETI